MWPFKKSSVEFDQDAAINNGYIFLSKPCIVGKFGKYTFYLQIWDSSK